VINTDYFKNKKITIVGLARSGSACANLLYDLGAQVYVTDNQENDSTRAYAAKLKSKDIRVELGRHTEDFLHNRDLVVVSPGVSDQSFPIAQAQKLHIPVISEIEVAWRLCPAEVIAVTGTNGKTTVTTLIGKILEAGGRRVFVCGNIGKAFCGEVEKMREGDFVSLEVSSFQLEKIQAFKPKVAVILNLGRNHLDRYKDMDEYLAAKKRIFMNQGNSDYLVLNHDDLVIKDVAKDSKSRVVYFSQDKALNPNQAAVLAVGSILEIEKELLLDVLKDFKGVEHRLEQAAQINNITFVNDSKATTVDATIWALENMPSSVILIAGGREKGNDYSAIIDLLRQKVKEAVLIGEAKEKMQHAFAGVLPLCEAPTLPEAVNIAFAKARPGDCVLLSPMCKSFDMFSDYEHRGRVFKEAVEVLARGQHGS
jgi:UDP-N-acetylmuramoylalanine--D-glutamate ligase